MVEYNASILTEDEVEDEKQHSDFRHHSNVSSVDLQDNDYWGSYNTTRTIHLYTKKRQFRLYVFVTETGKKQLWKLVVLIS